MKWITTSIGRLYYTPMFNAAFFTTTNLNLIFHNNHLKAAYMFTDGWMGKKDVAHTYNEINSAICDNTDGPWGNYAKWNRSEKDNTTWSHLCIKS